MLENILEPATAGCGINSTWVFNIKEDEILFHFVDSPKYIQKTSERDIGVEIPSAKNTEILTFREMHRIIFCMKSKVNT